MNDEILMVITDLDGTLLNNQQNVAKKDLETLSRLGKKGIIRVVATGRNFYSALKKLPPDFPIDYLIFSSGAGIYEWKTQQLIHSDYLPRDKVEHVARNLINQDIDFMIHEVIPENHKFVYHRSSRQNPDFERRLKLYREFAEPLDPKKESFQHSCQIIAIAGNHENLHQFLKERIQGAKVIRTTSPLDGVSMWVEIFPESVSKGHGVDWLCGYTKVDPSKTLGIGNDYNDLDLLHYTAISFAVENAPKALRRQYRRCLSNEQCGFTDAVKQIIAL